MSELALRLIAENKKTKAKFLDLGNCGLTEVPEEIGELVWLEELTFSDQWWDLKRRVSGVNGGDKNNVISMPWSMINLKNLKKIWLNDLKNLSDISFLEALGHLQLLRFENTSVSDLSPIYKLINLRDLFFWNCPILDITPLYNLTNLITLGCGNTLINDLSPLHSLTKLEILSCHRTDIYDLNPIAKLNNIKFFDCSQTKVVSLFPLLPIIKRGVFVKRKEEKSVLVKKKEGVNSEDVGILVEGCLLTNPPLEIVDQGNEAILRYFDEREKFGTDQIYEAKLLLIGEGGAGKTSLCRKLFHAEADLPKEKETTQGIDIQPLYFDLTNGKQFRLNVWDFAGQGKYQSAHSFFYTHRSLYVLVDDTRTLDENEAYRTFYNHWLQTAELFGGNSPLLVLHNQKADRVRTGFNLGSFQTTFPFVKELFRINLGGDDIAGIRDLKTQIERWAQKLPHIGDVVPKTWVKVREDIETERQARPFISYDRYCEICSEYGITDELKQSDLSHYFHDLGVFLHFPENPLLRRDVFLQNQWVTDAVYKILDDNEIASKQRGRFDKNDLARLWNEGLYTKRRDELLALMLQFELCYQIQDSETYVAPQLLPGHIPGYDLGADIPLQLKYEYGFMPKGLLYRLIVRLHRHIAQEQSAVWNSGVVLERLGAQADLLESLDRRQISVRATGARAKELVTIINEEVEKLHATYSDRLKVEVKIPCNCRICKEIKTPHFYDKKDLDNRLVKGKPTVECKESFDDVNVQGLLDGVFIKDFKNSKSPKMKKIFISYSHTDERLKEELDTHLSALKRSNLVEVWHDRRIDAGTKWDEEIKTELESADIILLLVSSNFLASDYIWKVEIAKAMERHQAKETRVIPIFLRACDTKDMPFAGLQGLPRDAKPVTSFADKDEAYLQIAKGIRNVLEA